MAIPDWVVFISRSVFDLQVQGRTESGVQRRDHLPVALGGR